MGAAMAWGTIIEEEIIEDMIKVTIEASATGAMVDREEIAGAT